jgi:cell wall assembly regulator SMI1
VQGLWQRLEAHLASHAPGMLNSLNPPVSEEALRRAEAALGVPLPADLAASLRVHDGQIPDSVPLVPAEYGGRRLGRRQIATWGELAPLDQIVRDTLQEREGMHDGAVLAEVAAAHFEFDGPVRRDGDWSWIVFVNAGSGDRLGLDLRPADGGQVGQVLSIVHDPNQLFVLAPSYRAWFQTLVERYEAGQYAVADQGTWHPGARDNRRRGRRP